MEDRATRLKRVTMRSWRRGMREMDLILGPYAEARLDALTPEALDAYEVLLDENDQDLYLWVTARINGRTAGPERHAALLDDIAAHSAGRLREIRGA